MFPNGTLKIKHSNGKGTQKFNPRTCLLQINERGTNKILGGTGAYRGVSGHGTYHLQIVGTRRHLAGLPALPARRGWTSPATRPMMVGGTAVRPSRTARRNEVPMHRSARIATRLRTAALAGAALAVIGAVSAPGLLAPAAATPAPADWPAFLHGPAHTSYNPSQTAITPANASSLTMKWHFVGDQPTMPGQPGPGYNASPTVADGAVFIGSRTGWFYKLNEQTGKVLAKTFIGFQPHLTCTAGGIVSTATVATDPSDGQDTVYVGAPDGYLYALNASNLSVKWRSVIAIPSSSVSDYFQWSSPTVSNGRIYIGVSSHCDNPLVRGGLIAYNQSTGKVLAHYYTVPKGVIGGSLWSSAAASSSYVYVSTGNGTTDTTKLYDTLSIVELRAGTLVKVAKFQIPASQRVFDADFGASPALFGSMVGACDKNGLYYALRVPSMKLAWERRVATSPGSTGDNTCNASSAYDGRYLYVAATATVIAGHKYAGSVRRLDPATGKVLWQTGLPNGVFGTPTLDGAGVLAVGTYTRHSTANAVYLLSAKTGHILHTVLTGSDNFAQSVFAGGWLFTANGNGVYAWAPPAAARR